MINNLEIEMPDGSTKLASELSRDEIIVAKVGIDSDIMEIKAQLSSARIAVGTRGEYSDPVWYRRANDALRHKRKQSQYLQALLGLKKSRREKSVERAFIEICRNRLDPELFRQIMDDALAEFQE